MHETDSAECGDSAAAKAAMTTAGQEWMAAGVRIDNGSVRRSKCKQRALLLWFRG